MKGLCVHNTTFSKGIQILESGYLKSVSEVPENSEYLYDSDDEEEKEQYLNTLKNKIFLSLLFETRKVNKKKLRDAGVGPQINFFFDPKIMEDYGHMDYSEKYKIKIIDNPKIIIPEYLIPKTRCWVNKDWHRGYFLINKHTLEYNRNKSLIENIKLFYKYIKPENPKLKNEVIINDKKFKLSKYLLAVGIGRGYKEYIEKLREDYPDIIFFNEEETEEFLKLYLEV